MTNLSKTSLFKERYVLGEAVWVMDMYRRPMEPHSPRSRLANSFKGPQWYTLAEAPITSSPRDMRASGGFGQWKGGLSSPRRPESAGRAHPSVSSYPARPSSARQTNLNASMRSTLTSTMRSTMMRGDPEAEARLDYHVRRQRMKKMCETFVDPRTRMVRTEDLQKSAKVRPRTGRAARRGG